MNLQTPSQTNDFVLSITRIRAGVIIAAVGLFLFILGAKPEWFHLDRSNVVGFVQIAVFLVGLAAICVGGYMGLAALWGNREKSIAADFGMRLISTGYVIAVFSGMADIFGMGSHPLPGVPHFGPWQALGVEIGMLVILVGFIMMIPFSRRNK